MKCKYNGCLELAIKGKKGICEFCWEHWRITRGWYKHTWTGTNDLSFGVDNNE